MTTLLSAVTPAPGQDSLMKLFICVEHWETWTAHTWQLPTALQIKQPLLFRLEYQPFFNSKVLILAIPSGHCLLKLNLLRRGFSSRSFKSAF